MTFSRSLLTRGFLLGLLLSSASWGAAQINYQLNFVSNGSTDTVTYTGTASNWVSPSCGINPASGSISAYGYCQGELDGDLLPGPTRASLTSPSTPFSSNGYYFELLNGQGGVSDLISFNPTAGCGTPTVTCGVAFLFASALTSGGTLSPGLVSAFATQTLAGTATANGTNQLGFTLNWSNGRTDLVNAQIVGASATPEPSTGAMAAMAALLVAGFARLQRARRSQSIPTI